MRALRRPILYYTLFFAWGQLAAYYASGRSSVFLFAAWLGSAVFICLAAAGSGDLRAAGKRTVIAAAAFFIAGSLIMALQTARLDPREEAGFTEQGRYLVRVESVRPSRSGLYLDCEGLGKIDGVSGTAGPFGHRGGRIRLSYPGSGTPEEDAWLYSLIGKEVAVGAELTLPESAGNPRTFDYRRYLLGRGISFTGKLIKAPVAEDVRDEGSRLSALRRWVALGRGAFLDRIRGEGDRAFASGILFGDTTGMDEDELEEFRRNGTAHILAVSGLHIGALASLLTRLRNRTGRNWTVAPCAFLLMLYGEASCWSPSVVRAVMLAVVRMAAEVTDRPYDSTEAAALVSLCILAARPYMIFDQGFQMSFLALLSINFLLPYLKPRIGSGAAVMLAVQAVMIPYSAFVYNVFSPLAVILNIPMVFLASVYTPIGAGGFMAELFAGMTGPVPDLLSGLGRLIKTVDHILFLGNPAAMRVPSPPLWAEALLLAAVFLLASEWGEVFLRERKNVEMRRLFAAVLIVAALSSWYAGRSPFDNADMVFLDVGQGDSLHVKAGGGVDVLIDGGGNAYRNVGRDTLMPYLLHNGVRNVDLALATHLHTDHFLGLEQLAEEYPVREIVTEGLAGDVIKAGDVDIRILWPAPENAGSPDENFGSLVFMVEKEGVRMLVTGDLTEEGENALLSMYAGTDELRCHILKVAHHGSRFSTTDAFLETADPLIAVIGVGRNEYGHPAPSVIEKLEAKGIMVFRTDRDGAVGMIITEDGIRVCTGRSTRTEDFSTTWRQAG